MASWLIFATFAIVVIFDPVLGKRIQSSDAYDDTVHDDGAAIMSLPSQFDGVWKQGYSKVTVQRNEFVSADGRRLKAKITKGDPETITVIYPDGQTYTAHLSPDGQQLIWNDGDIWTRVTHNNGNNVEDFLNGLDAGRANVDAYPNMAPNRPNNHHNFGPGGAGWNPNMGPNMAPNMPLPAGDPRTRFWPINRHMKRGRRGEPLIPELVPPFGMAYEFKNKEKPRTAQVFFENVDTNEYKWEFDEIITQNYRYKLDQKFATLKGRWQSNSFGHKSVHVLNNHGDEMFKIRMAKHTLNPFKLRQSFRILPAGSKSNDDTLFTINKDFFGKGFLGVKEEWRIYEGRKRDKKMIYYCIGNYMGWDFKFYRTKLDYDLGNKQVLAKIEQKRNAGAWINHNFLPDKFKLTVYPGGDSALLLAVSTIIDMVHDSTNSQGFVDFD